MVIHVVQDGETAQSIAAYYGISESKLIQDNELEFPNNLVIGQSIVIAYPERTYVVMEGDTLLDIANSNNVSVMQLLRNNPFLSDREYIYPGETIVISYPIEGVITVHGNTNPNINNAILRRTLPYLTYLSIINYTVTKEGEIITYYDDTEIVNTTKEYGVVPLMLITTLSIQGAANVGVEYDLLLNQEFQQKFIDNIIPILRTVGYYGINISFQYINITNISLYDQFFSQVTERLNNEGFQVFVTVGPDIRSVNNEVIFEKVDYSVLNRLAQNIIFMDYNWATTINPPSPISSIYNLNVFLEYINNFIPPEKVIIGIPTIGYDWELPFSAGFSSVYSLTVERAIDLARIFNARIQFDEKSQTPYFLYTDNNTQHIVWFIDARSINALLDLVIYYNYHGSGIWNITIYNPQLWLIINSQYDIEKVLISV